MLIVHHLNHSRSHRIMWLLEELGVPYYIEKYDREPRTGLAPESLKTIHPLGKSPVITDGGRAIAESGAIIDYIVRRHGAGRLSPDPSTQAYDQYVHWLHYAEGSASLPLVMKGTVDRLNDTWRPLKKHVAEELHLHLSYIDASLVSGDFLLGSEFTAADVQLSFIGELAKLRTDRTAYPHMEAWIGRLQARPAYAAAIVKGGEYAFAET
jgi:glutathione S-transferase